jgi:ribose transport system ATP-binding protein
VQFSTYEKCLICGSLYIYSLGNQRKGCGVMGERQLIFETKQLSKTFGPTKAVDKVDLKIYRGEITGLIGENGSGKSTITSIIAGMQPPSDGEMLYEGRPHKPATMIEAAKAGIGMIVQEQGYVSGITVAQNIFWATRDAFAPAR